MDRHWTPQSPRRTTGETSALRVRFSRTVVFRFCRNPPIGRDGRRPDLDSSPATAVGAWIAAGSPSVVVDAVMFGIDPHGRFLVDTFSLAETFCGFVIGPAIEAAEDEDRVPFSDITFCVLMYRNYVITFSKLNNYYLYTFCNTLLPWRVKTELRLWNYFIPTVLYSFQNHVQLTIATQYRCL